MEYLALYRKYRPKKLDEVVGQNEVKKILASSVKNGTITHAYLFSGPRGTGKTTMAKILAKMVNCLNPIDGNACGECEICKNILNSNDVIEIDAASNNGVDEIRDLREKANLVPSNARYKVYIIDEVHMLTTQAFNALLKTLEEPPKHVIFILATTEYYKIPLTITSRCQKFQFNKISNDEIVGRLKEISKLENIEIEDEALNEIAKISDGGMRDSINFLDQVRSFSSTKITIDDVYDVCGNVSSEEFVELFTNIRNNDAEKITNFFENLDINGKSYSKFNEDVISFLKDVVLFKKNVSYKYIKVDTDMLKNIANLFSTDEIFYIIDGVNKLMDRLKNVSRQSVVVITSYLLMMNKLNVDALVDVKEDRPMLNFKKNNDIQKNDEYGMAFQFTSSEQNANKDLTDNEQVNDSNNSNINDNEFKKNQGDNKDIIINNTFAVASKELKNNLQAKLSTVSDYLTDKKFMTVAGSLIDTKIEVAGDGYVIFSVPNEALVDKIYSNFKLCQDLINVLFGSNFNFVVITTDEWSKYRDDYINNIKLGKKYYLKELCVNNSLIDESTLQKEPTIVDKLFDLVGEDVVEFK